MSPAKSSGTEPRQRLLPHRPGLREHGKGQGVPALSRRDLSERWSRGPSLFLAGSGSAWGEVGGLSTSHSARPALPPCPPLLLTALGPSFLELEPLASRMVSREPRKVHAIPGTVLPMARSSEDTRS